MAFINFADAQVAASFTTALFAIALYALTIRRLHGVAKVCSRIMCLGYMIASMQFAMQRLFEFHTHDSALGFSINLLALMPVTYLLAMAQLYLMRQGHVRRDEWLPVPTAWLCSLALIVASRIYDHYNPGPDGVVIMWANYIVAGVYALVIIFLYRILRHTYQALHSSLQEFFDQSMSSMISWISLSIRFLMLLTIILPVFVFFRGPWLVVYIYIAMAAMAYLFVAFTCFSVSNDAAISQKAEAIAAEAKQAPVSTEDGQPVKMTEAEKEKIAQKLEGWLTGRKYLEHDISIKDVADATGVSLSQLRA